MSLEKIGDYTITRQIGQGGMGRVCEALCPAGRTVAVKSVLWGEGLSSRARWEMVERFQREARAARSLQHPNIVQVLDIGAEADTFFIVMEFLDGQSVRELINIAGAIKLERAVEIIITVCGALSYAHDQGIVHRDIKPDNILIARTGQVKLTDFGIASIVYEKGVTQTGTMVGTLSYMSPEQARGEKSDARSDIFSLGATFYEMLTGRRAFEGDGPAAVLHRIINDEPGAVTGVPPHVSRCLSKCLRKQPHYRFQSVREIVDALQTPQATSETLTLPAGAHGAAAVFSAPPPGVSPAGRPLADEPTPGAARRIPDLRCGKCHEPMDRNTPSCWRCGTPNPLITHRREHAENTRALQDALESLNRRKGGWLRRKK